jgi:hypothetical protein
MNHNNVVPDHRTDLRPCSVCGENRDYLPHGDAADCERQMRRSGSHCANSAEHHRYAPVEELPARPAGWFRP